MVPSLLFCYTLSDRAAHLFLSFWTIGVRISPGVGYKVAWSSWGDVSLSPRDPVCSHKLVASEAETTTE